MSTFSVKMVKISSIQPHQNADRLEIAMLEDWGWNVVVAKGFYSVGQFVLYLPIDSVLPVALEQELFPEDSKIKLHKSRIRATKIRQVVSYGMLVSVDKIKKVYPDFKPKENYDYAKDLGIVKYEEPEEIHSGTKTKAVKKWHTNPLFDRYTDIENSKYYNEFKYLEPVYVTTKVHGCLQADTMISCFDGTKHSIKDIVDNKMELELVGVDENGNIVPTKITNWFNNGQTKDWKRVKFTRKRCGLGNNYGSVVCTPNHKFYNDSTKQYVPCSELKQNDVVTFLRKDKKLSYEQEQILIGKFLGDGHYSKRSRHIAFGHKEDHLEYIQETLLNLGDIAGERLLYAVSGYGTNMVRAKTKANYLIEEMFTPWFVDGKKQISKDIIEKLSPISLAYWYMDDGSLAHSKFQKDRACFATCAFNEQSVEYLVLALAKLGLEAVKYCSGGFWRIRLNCEAADKAFKMMAPYMPMCMRYKLPEYYRNIPYKKIRTNSSVTYTKANQTVLSVSDCSFFGNFNKYDIETETHNFVANGVLVHNSSWRAFCLPASPRTLLDKIKKFFGLFPEYEYGVGSRNRQIDMKKAWAGFYAEDVYTKIYKQYDIENKLKKNMIIYGEIVGDGIQKGYMYGCKPGEHKLYVYDIKVDGKYLDVKEFLETCKELGLETVPVCGIFPYTDDLPNIYMKLNPLSKEVNEGVVIKPLKERIGSCGRVVLKYINPEYLLNKNNSDHH